MNVRSSTQCAEACAPSTCRLKCSLEVVDELLSTREAITGEDMDLLLDFRSLLRARDDAEATLRSFCDLRRRLEHRHYLAFFRLRRWLENNVVCEITGPETAGALRIGLRLDYYCVEAVRRSLMCAAIQKGFVFEKLRLSFAFNEARTTVPVLPEIELVGT